MREAVVQEQDLLGWLFRQYSRSNARNQQQQQQQGPLMRRRRGGAARGALLPNSAAAVAAMAAASVAFHQASEGHDPPRSRRAAFDMADVL